MPAVIPELTLVELWRIKHNTPYYWRIDGRLAPTETVNTAHFYSPETIDRLHVATARNFVPWVIPTVSELLAASQPSLLTIKEVADLLDRTVDAASRLRLPHFALSNQVLRYPAACVADYMAGLPGDTAVRTRIASRVLCLGMAKVREYINNGTLAKVFNPHLPTYLHATRQSILDLLETQVRGVSPEEWWNIALLEPGNRMLTKQEVIAELGMARETLTPKVKRGEVACIVTEAGSTFFPQSSVVALEMSRLYNKVARLFDVTPAEAQRWIRAGQFNFAHLPKSASDEDRLLAFIEQRATHPLLDAHVWYVNRAQHGMPLLDFDDVTSLVDCDQETIQAALEAGDLLGVRLPKVDRKNRIVVAMNDAGAFRRMYV